MSNTKTFLSRILTAKRRYRFAIFFSVITGFLSIVSLYATLTDARTSNDECIWQPIKKDKGTALSIHNIKKDGVTDNAGIKEGDTLIKINDQEFSSTFAAQDIINRVSSGSYAKYTISRDGSIFETTVRIKKLLSFGELSFGLLSFFWLIIGFIVYTAKPEGEIQKLFFKIGISFAFTRTMVLFTPFFPKIIYSTIFLDYIIIYSLVATLHAYWFFKFFQFFPIKSKIYTNKIAKTILYVIGAGCFIATIIRFFSYTSSGIPISPLTIGNAFGFLNVASVSVYVYGFVKMVLSLIKLRKTAQKKPILIITLAYAIAILSILFVIYIPNYLGYVVYNSPEYYTPIVLIVLVPIAFAYSIFKYQLMDISYVVQTTMIYAMATVALAASYILIVYGLGFMAGFAVPAIYQGITTLLFFVFFALVFQSAKEKIQEALSRKFYPEQYLLRQSLRGFTTQLARIVGEENILAEITNLFKIKIGLENFIIAVRDKSGEISCSQISLHHADSDTPCFHEKKFLHAVMQKIETGNIPVFDHENIHQFFSREVLEKSQDKYYTLVPMMISQKITGFFLLGLKQSGSQFGASDYDLLYTVGQQAAIAFENARLYEVEAERKKIERDLELARNIQQSLLPKKLPIHKNAELFGKMLPASQVGGDYFDIISPSPDKMFVVVGDVSGKGLAASLYMAKIQTLMQIACSNGHTPKEILIDLNTKIYNFLDKRSFATINLALFNFNDKTVKICRAGHPPMAIIENENIREIKSKGLGLGLESGKIFAETIEETTVPITPGQLFVFYSDGMNESMNLNNECYGTENFLEVIKSNSQSNCDKISEKVWENIENFRTTAPQHDDMTLVLLKVLE